MAVGDNAVAAGIEVVPGSGKANDLDMYINRLADELARRSAAQWLKDLLGLTASSTMPLERWIKNGNFGSDDLSIRYELGRAVFKVNATDQGQIAYLTDIPAAPPQQDISGKRDYSDGYFPGDVSAKNVYLRESFGASSGWTVAYVNNDGRLSKGTSSLRYKDLLTDPDVNTLGDIWPTLRQFAMKGGDGKPVLGYIAEEVADNPDTERFAVYQFAEGDDGQWRPTNVVDSIDFIQMLLAQVAQLNVRLKALEAPHDTPGDPA